MRTKFFLAFVFLASIQIAAAAPKVHPFFSVQRKTLPEIQKILGKPLSVKKKPNGELEMARFKVKGYKSVEVMFSKDTGKESCESLDAYFAKPPATWQDALKLAGLSSQGVQPQEGQGRNGRWVALRSMAFPDGCQVTFMASDGHLSFYRMGG